MKRLRRGTLLAIAFLFWPAAVRAAEVAILKSSEIAAWRETLVALRLALGGHTLVEHDFRGDRGEAERILNSLKGRTLVLVALGPLAAQAAHELLPEAPLVFCMVQDPARLGLVAGPKLTGVIFNIPVKNQMAAFRMVNPRGVRIGVVYNEANVGRLVEDAQKAAGVLRLLIVTRPVASDREVPQALRSLLSGDQAADAVWIPPDPLLLGDESRRFVLTETLKARKPIYGFSSSLVAEGALVSNGPDFKSIGELAGELANRLVGGEQEKIDLAVPRAELVINRKMAAKLKIEIPADILKAAQKTLE